VQIRRESQVQRSATKVAISSQLNIVWLLLSLLLLILLFAIPEGVDDRGLKSLTKTDAGIVTYTGRSRSVPWSFFQRKWNDYRWTAIDILWNINCPFPKLFLALASCCVFVARPCIMPEEIVTYEFAVLQCATVFTVLGQSYYSYLVSIIKKKKDVSPQSDVRSVRSSSTKKSLPFGTQHGHIADLL
jgi:hypothetical protein